MQLCYKRGIPKCTISILLGNIIQAPLFLDQPLDQPGSSVLLLEMLPSCVEHSARCRYVAVQNE